MPIRMDAWKGYRPFTSRVKASSRHGMSPAASRP
jgi:hypothetical protein